MARGSQILDLRVEGRRAIYDVSEKTRRTLHDANITQFLGQTEGRRAIWGLSEKTNQAFPDANISAETESVRG